MTLLPPHLLSRNTPQVSSYTPDTDPMSLETTLTSELWNYDLCLIQVGVDYSTHGDRNFI